MEIQSSTCESSDVHDVASITTLEGLNNIEKGWEALEMRLCQPHSVMGVQYYCILANANINTQRIIILSSFLILETVTVDLVVEVILM